VKAAVNGVPTLAAPGSGDGRWRYDTAPALYALIEEEIVPAYYQRSRDGVPRRWTSIVRETLADAIPRYSARRALLAAAGIQG
jgi:glucan phosphorylase